MNPPGTRHRPSLSAVDTRVQLRHQSLLVAVLLAAMAGPVWTRQAALRIVVIAGEDAVNVIQQKTAVAPIVEVRDRNDLPVSGATVTFAIGGGNTATFAGGAQTFTVATNAAGRAAVTALNPLSSGAVQINVQAAFQGQTAVATITQTNVLTAAQAAVASGGASGSAGGSSGGAAGDGAGGGFSGTTLGIVGGVVAGGALAATKVLGENGGSPTVRYSGSYSGDSLRFIGPCTHRLAQTGTISIALTVTADGMVTGVGGVDGTSTHVSLTPPGCLQPDPPLNTVSMHGCCNPAPPLVGTTNAFTFHGSHPGNLGTIWDYAFSGMLSSNEVIGTFTLTITEGAPRVTPPFAVRLTRQ